MIGFHVDIYSHFADEQKVCRINFNCTSESSRIECGFKTPTNCCVHPDEKYSRPIRPFHTICDYASDNCSLQTFDFFIVLIIDLINFNLLI